MRRNPWVVRNDLKGRKRTERQRLAKVKGRRKAEIRRRRRAAERPSLKKKLPEETGCMSEGGRKFAPPLHRKPGSRVVATRLVIFKFEIGKN
jgi:hypothetical protein